MFTYLDSESITRAFIYLTYRNYQLQGTVPLMFIVPDGNQLGHAKLFPKEIAQELHIHSIS